MSRRGLVLFAAMSAIWGVPYLLISVAVDHLAVPVVVCGRTGLAALVLVPLAQRRGALGPALRHWRPVLAFTALEMAGPWLLLTDAEKKLPSSLAGLLVACVPMVAAVAAFGLGERSALKPARLAGIAVGMVGVAFVVGVGREGGGGAWNVIEVLLVCSVRRANLIDLELGKSIRKIGHGKDAFWVIERDGVEVKNEEDLRFKLDGPTVELLELYLRDWRPKLCPHSSPWLFPAADGTCLDPRTMAHAVGAQSKRVLGVAITPHQFRHISAALWMKDNPEDIFTISQHLGHRDVNTTRRYYAPPQQRRASRHFQEHILRSRETARIRIKRTTRRKGGGSGAGSGFDERRDLL